MSFRGLANDVYYILDPADQSRYADYTGCGNTLNAGHAVVRRLILDSLRYWVQEMHVDGFRFDLASMLTRGADGEPVAQSAGHLGHRLGPGSGRHQADRRGLGRGRPLPGRLASSATPGRNGTADSATTCAASSSPTTAPCAALAKRLAGSPDIYGQDAREPEQSINFVTVHDGFTLNDLVSYNDKHNEANGEDNRDGANDNLSWNCGVEGPTDDPAVEALRNRQVKNFFTLLLAAVGAPLILMGDEVRRTQRGNNNAYCQDNELSWFDWTLLEQARRHPSLRQATDRRSAFTLAGAERAMMYWMSCC